MDNAKVIKVAAIQMNTVLYDCEANLKKAEHLVEQAVQEGARLIVLPELFNTGYLVEDEDVNLSERIPGKTTRWMEQLAHRYQIYIAAAIMESGESVGVVYDTALLVGPEGLIGTYRKTHLWDPENTRFAKGDSYPVFQTPIGKIGLQICYDIGFPEGARILTLKGADIVLYPSAYGQPRLYAWDVATRARALENGIFVIASNRTGTEKERATFGGHSRITDPLGRVLAEAAAEDEVIVSEIDLDTVAKQRRALPYLRDRNKLLFKKEFENI
ncbi:carbon-nitrogen hydrolase family protein [Paenibacillus beijingensis]|uniref:Aminohydrolase n=1 Tax=Paenibacillus beijingensis TaxID=1126833 RepID=A0A0D5NS77_9BACL|nr:carbon-nitrogen hydrolase family protein [Paenibacillus beijingensis]AJY77758.1 aminohydrolase [Paenibacillus beijingensis]